jgi:hypothetical protein
MSERRVPSREKVVEAASCLGDIGKRLLQDLFPDDFLPQRIIWRRGQVFRSEVGHIAILAEMTQETIHVIDSIRVGTFNLINLEDGTIMLPSHFQMRVLEDGMLAISEDAWEASVAMNRFLWEPINNG